MLGCCGSRVVNMWRHRDGGLLLPVLSCRIASPRTEITLCEAQDSVGEGVRGLNASHGVSDSCSCLPCPHPPFFLVCAPGKPAALILVEQALQAGMEKVVLVVAPHAQAEFEMFFSWPVAPEVGMRA